jgi:hypothetical protein
MRQVKGATVDRIAGELAFAVSKTPVSRMSDRAWIAPRNEELAAKEGDHSFCHQRPCLKNAH